MAQKIKVSHIKGYRLQNQKINGTSRGIFLVQPTELAENNRKGDEMNYIVGFMFVVLVAIIIRQRHQFEKMRQSARFMSYYAKLNENAKLHAQFQANTAEMLLRMQGYDIERILNGDNSQRVISNMEKEVILKEHDANKKKLDEADKVFEQVKTKYESEVIQ
ncbi:hypothetical protein [Leuconostoc mesenteroides]|uniref:hypothetical protein n=3 Tax=Leuconostoc TaxID=1243 RepID=UPI00235FA726|nr:hypothetical protein [Leuconostoc mesenteroides]